MKKINNRLGLFLFFVLLFWAKTILAYYLDFSLGVKGAVSNEKFYGSIQLLLRCYYLVLVCILKSIKHLCLA